MKNANEAKEKNNAAKGAVEQGTDEGDLKEFAKTIVKTKQEVSAKCDNDEKSVKWHVDFFSEVDLTETEEIVIRSTVELRAGKGDTKIDGENKAANYNSSEDEDSDERIKKLLRKVLKLKEK